MQEILVERLLRLLEWATRKTHLNLEARRGPFFNEREIWWASMGENIGSELNGKNKQFERPVVILKKISGDMAIVIPCTSRRKSGNWYFPFGYHGKNACAVISQIRTVSNRRFIRPIATLDPEQWKKLKNAVVRFISA